MAYWLLFFLLVITDISATVALIGVKFCMMAGAYMSVPDRFSPLLGAVIITVNLYSAFFFVKEPPNALPVLD